MLATILHRNAAGSVVLIDLTVSIQGGQNARYSLRSSAALESPYRSTEPKGAKRDSLIESIPLRDRCYHDSLQTCISLALTEIRRDFGGQGDAWCYTRRPVISAAVSLTLVGAVPGPPTILSTTEARTRFPSLRDLECSVVSNPQDNTAVVAVSDLGAFFVPPRSKFILATLGQGFPAFAAACHDFFSASPEFDLILMDPPWSNRSVRHSRAYKMQENQVRDPFEDAVRLIQGFLGPRGWVAIWVTNKSSVRTQVLQKLQNLGMHLEQEWIWIKVTVNGEPVTQLDGIWRRPYECLLIFRRGSHAVETKRRVIACVPEVHSRKPCLKMLLEELLPQDYTALELFARSLTAGWWSWGDEVLKFQHESQWASQADSDAEP